MLLGLVKSMDAQKLVAGAISLASIGVGYGNIQLANLADQVSALNKTMIEVVQRQGFTDKEMTRIESRVDEKTKLILDLLKKQSNK